MGRVKLLSCVLGILAAGSAANSVSAQTAVNLSGTYRCMQGCGSSLEGKAYVTQNGRDLNIVTETGVAVQAWFDVFTPTTRIWMEALHQGAVYSPDGMTIQFDQGALLRRIDDPEHVAIAYCARRFRSYDPVSQTYLGRDGQRHTCS
jgi:hypothetical protein